MSSPSAKRELQRSLDAETLQGRRLFKMLPDAFVFSYAASEGNLVRLSFRPNPSSIRPPWRPACSTTWKARCGSTANRSDWLGFMVISHRPVAELQAGELKFELPKVAKGKVEAAVAAA